MKKIVVVFFTLLFVFIIGAGSSAGQEITTGGKLTNEDADAGVWYVSPDGDDVNTCASPSAPCATINAAIGKAAAGDTVYIQNGRYFDDSLQVIHIDKSVDISGGWNDSFSIQDGMSIIDGEDSRVGINAEPLVNSTISNLIIEDCSLWDGSGITNNASLIIQNSIIRNNHRGGIYNSEAGQLSLIDSRIDRNVSYGQGGGIFSEGELILIRSAVINNSAYFGGGIRSTNKLLIINSTISGNTAIDDAGISSTFGGGIYNSTITHNTASRYVGGIHVGDVFLIQNSILADNESGQGSAIDCHGPLTSGGYTLVGNTAGCDFIPSSGDLLNVDPLTWRLYDIYALLPTSPAIDAGNPAGCLDDQNQPILVDQRGSPRPIDGNGDGTVICDMGAYEFDPDHPHHLNFLPITQKPCPTLYEDDFNNPNSGWPVKDDQNLLLEYNGGEYRMLLRSPQWYVITRPGFSASDYNVSVDLRNVTGVMGSYGIAFGVAQDWSGLYSLEIYPDGWFGLYRYDQSGGAVLAEAYSPAIHQGTDTNHISVYRNGSSIKAYANETLLASVSDSYFTGSLYLGLINFSYNMPNVDARYDNFRVISSFCDKSMQADLLDEWQPGWMESQLGILLDNMKFMKHQP